MWNAVTRSSERPNATINHAPIDVMANVGDLGLARSRSHSHP